MRVTIVIGYAMAVLSLAHRGMRAAGRVAGHLRLPQTDASPIPVGIR